QASWRRQAVHPDAHTERLVAEFTGVRRTSALASASAWRRVRLDGIRGAIDDCIIGGAMA
ncbi:MAG TPA: hypothetical protein VIC27_11380, partial [Ktedonobacterales bacterium]